MFDRSIGSHDNLILEIVFVEKDANMLTCTNHFQRIVDLREEKVEVEFHEKPLLLILSTSRFKFCIIAQLVAVVTCYWRLGSNRCKSSDLYKKIRKIL